MSDKLLINNQHKLFTDNGKLITGTPCYLDITVDINPPKYHDVLGKYYRSGTYASPNNYYFEQYAFTNTNNNWWIWQEASNMWVLSSAKGSLIRTYWWGYPIISDEMQVAYAEGEMDENDVKIALVGNLPLINVSAYSGSFTDVAGTYNNMMTGYMSGGCTEFRRITSINEWYLYYVPETTPKWYVSNYIRNIMWSKTALTPSYSSIEGIYSSASGSTAGTSLQVSFI